MSTGYVDCDSCVADGLGDDYSLSFFTFGNLSATWVGQAEVATAFDDDLLHHGDFLNLDHSITSSAGTLRLTINANSYFELLRNGGHVMDATTDTTVSQDIACAMPSPGAPTTCGGHVGFDLPTRTLFDVPSREVDATVRIEFDVNVSMSSSQHRAFDVLTQANGGVTASVFQFNSGFPNIFIINCGVPAGSDIYHRIGSVSNTMGMNIQLSNPNTRLTVTGDTEDISGVQIVSLNGALDASHSGNAIVTGESTAKFLGVIAADRVRPVAITNSSFAGTEGSTVTFNSSSSFDNCFSFELTHRWDFSDGGVAFGSNA